MTTLTAWEGPLTWEQMLQALRRVMEDPTVFLELTLGGIVFRIYPAEIPPTSEKDSLRLFADFLLALQRQIRTGENTYAIRTPVDVHDQVRVELGVIREEPDELGLVSWVPVEIARFERPGPPQVSLPFLDQVNVVRTVQLRRIVL